MAALMVVAVPAPAAPTDGRFDPRYTPALQEKDQPPVIHELHTVIRERDAGRTLAFVLSGAAILIATGAAAFTTVSTRRRTIPG
jgi:hypothetical protein